MQLMSSSFQAAQTIPARFTCEGEDISPEFFWKDAPRETKSFALILHDPDAPRANGFTHWVVYNIPAETTRIEQNVPKQKLLISGLGMQGRNDAGKIGYMGPCPPSGMHRYFARLYALRKELDLQPGASREEVNEAMTGQIIEHAELMGTYALRQKKTA
jgi:Raf kinase inhibitor-like YbhB/YbcL family protein